MMAATKHGHQPPRRLGWAALAYHKQEGATPDPGPYKSGRMAAEKEHFFDDLRSEWDLHSVGELVLGMGDFNGNVGKHIEGYEHVHGGNRIGERNVEDVRVL